MVAMVKFMDVVVVLIVADFPDKLAPEFLNSCFVCLRLTMFCPHSDAMKMIVSSESPDSEDLNDQG